MRIIHTTPVERSALGFSQIVARVKAGESFPESADGDYVSRRIPGIVECPDGSLAAYFEYRTGGDWSAIDLAMRRSEDGGRSWSEPVILESGRGRMTLNNPVMIRGGDALVFLWCQGYKRLFCKKSYDSGRSWTGARELTDTVDACLGDTFWSNLAPGPGHGIRTHSGRLIVPVWFACNRTDIYAHHPSFVTTLYSDDRGDSWRLGSILQSENIPDPNESALCQLPDGRLMINTRNISDDRMRAIAFSSNDGGDFTPLKLNPALPDPICMGSMCRAEDKVLFSNCRAPKGRKNLTLSVLDSEGNPTDSLQICPLGGYSDVCYSATRRRAYLLYEANDCTEILCSEIEFE